MRNLKINNNAPITIGFVLICVAALVLNYLTSGISNRLIFSVYHSSLLNPLTYIRMITHIFGHADIEHLLGNILFILLLGPTLEERYGAKILVFCILITALITGIITYILFPNISLLGASGVVFMMIVLSSFTSVKEGTIPLTFILVFILYIGREVYQGLFTQDEISQFGHIVGGICGTVLGAKINNIKILK